MTTAYNSSGGSILSRSNGGYNSGTASSRYKSPNYNGKVIDTDIIDSLPNLSINIDKIFSLSSEDKIQIWKMVDEIISIYSKGQDEGYTQGQALRLKLIYNTLYNSDYLCTKRDKNLANLLEL